ncbi:MAG: hypothetical protein O3B21_14685 [Proteobacteria bacterium]|nr:hypothetical protein [Pseudomonadota bacterium]MDA1354946.1 hypothetical protein [Pseudomonadota bacterium]
MSYASGHAMRRIRRIKAAPGMTADDQAQAIQNFINSGQVKRITSADVIAHHDEVNGKNGFMPSTVLTS